MKGHWMLIGVLCLLATSAYEVQAGAALEWQLSLPLDRLKTEVFIKRWQARYPGLMVGVVQEDGGVTVSDFRPELQALVFVPEGHAYLTRADALMWHNRDESVMSAAIAWPEDVFNGLLQNHIGHARHEREYRTNDERLIDELALSDQLLAYWTEASGGRYACELDSIIDVSGTTSPGRLMVNLQWTALSELDGALSCEPCSQELSQELRETHFIFLAFRLIARRGTQKEVRERKLAFLDWWEAVADE